MLIRFIFTLLIVILAGPGCGLIYKQNIQQGNAIEQDDLDELYIGMNQRQVLFVLGTPSVKDPFHQNRWDYVQTFSRRGGDMVERTVTLKFDDDLLAEIIGGTDPFGYTGDSEDGDPSEVASFVKKPDADATDTDATDTNTTVTPDASSTIQSPQEASVESVKEEVLKGVDPDIETINERNADDRDYQKGQDLLDQTPDSDITGPDIDG